MTKDRLQIKTPVVTSKAFIECCQLAKSVGLFSHANLGDLILQGEKAARKISWIMTQRTMVLSCVGAWARA